MRFVVLVLLMGFVGCDSCTKANPNACCTDQSDCNAKGIPVGQMCEQGLICRGNQCIAETCNTGSDCDLSAPFCVDTMCAAMCTADNQCPGNGGSAGNTFCVSGGCVACRQGMSDCPASSPICDMNACRGCRADSECASTACDIDTGKCLDELSVVYAAPNGSASSTCTKATPCTFSRALDVADASRPNIKLTPGTYTTTVSKDFTGTFPLSVEGPATIDYLGISGNGGRLRVRDLDVTYTINCNASNASGAPPVVDVARVSLTSDLASGPALGAGGCEADYSQVVVNVTTNANGGIAAQFSGAGGGGAGGATVRFDRSAFFGGNAVIQLFDSTTIAITNSLFVGQGPNGPLSLTTNTSLRQSGTVAFSTFYDSVLTCPSGNALVTFSNNIFFNENVGAPANTVSGTMCSHSYDLIKPQATAVGMTNILGQDPHFVNAAAKDFHLMVGSPAIDAADPGATITTDYDGTTRPQGARRDIGAFEYKP